MGGLGIGLLFHLLVLHMLFPLLHQFSRLHGFLLYLLLLHLLLLYLLISTDDIPAAALVVEALAVGVPATEAVVSAVAEA